MNKPLAVVICAHNRMNFVAQTLDILEMQSLAPEVIVVDDGEQWSLATSPCVDTYIHERPDGLYHRVAKFNLGVRMAKAPYVVLLDDDCVPQSFDFVVGYLQGFDNAPIVRGMFLQEDGSYKLPPWFSTANIGFERSTYLDLGGFDMQYDGRYGYEDVHWEKVVQAAGIKTVEGSPFTAVKHAGEPFSGDRVATQENEKRYRAKWGL